MPSGLSPASTEEHGAVAPRILWGLYDVSLNESGSFDVVPLRGAQYTVNVNLFMQPPAGSLSNMGVAIVNESQLYTKGRVVIDVSLTHPLPSNPEYAGFDVLGIFMHNGSTTAVHDIGVKYALAGTNAILSNADGYTRWMNRKEFTASGVGGYTEGAMGNKGISWTATVNPYKYFCDGLGATESVATHYSGPAVNDRGVFRAGKTNTRRYDLTFPMSGGYPAVVFQYAVVASWVEPNHTPPTSVPGDFPAAANIREPFFITASAEGSTAYWNSSSDKGGNLLLTLEIFDQGAKDDPQSVEGQISDIIIESPNGFIPGIHRLTFTSSSWTASPGTTLISQKFVLDCGAVDPQGPNLSDNQIFIAVTSSDGSYDTGCGTPHPSAKLRSFRKYSVPLVGFTPGAPADVTGFQASDALGSLGQHQVKLTWDDNPDADEYLIQREDYSTTTKTWGWVDIYTAVSGELSYTDSDARYSGAKNPIGYRIRAQNAYGQSPSWVTDTGYPKLRGVKIAFWCVADDSCASPAVSWSRATADYNDAKSFWNGYGFDFTMVNTSNFFWICKFAYLDLTGTEDQSMHGNFGQVLHSDAINVYYVRTAEGSYDAAYCMAICPGSQHTTVNTFLVMCVDSRNCTPIVAPHELGHALTRFWDVYLLDLNWDIIMNDGATCANTNTWCNGQPPFLPYETPVMYCDDDATYPEEPGASGKVPKNLMWYSFCGSAVNQYDLTVGQYIEASAFMKDHESGYPSP
jgi:hypothetical protein